MIAALVIAALLLITSMCTGQDAQDPVKDASRTPDDYTFRIHPDLPEYSFHVRRDQDSVPTAIEVISKDTLVQTLEIPDDVDTAPAGIQVIAAEDVNGDGYADLKFLHWWGATGNQAYFYWLFNKDSGRFEYEKKLAEMSNVSPDPETHEIKTHSNLGAAGNSYSEQVYRFAGKKLVLVREIKQEWSDQNQCFYRVVREHAADGVHETSHQCIEVK